MIIIYLLTYITEPNPRSFVLGCLLIFFNILLVAEISLYSGQTIYCGSTIIGFPYTKRSSFKRLGTCSSHYLGSILKTINQSRIHANIL